MLRRLVLSAPLLVMAACGSARTPAGSPAPRQTIVIPITDARGQATNTQVTVASEADGRAVAVNAPADSIYSRLAAAMTGLGIQLGTIDPANRTMGNAQMTVSRRLGDTLLSRYLDCGSTPIGLPVAETTPIRLSVLTTVVPQGEASLLRTVVTAGSLRGEQSGAIPCQTTGLLERRIADAVRLQLARR